MVFNLHGQRQNFYHKSIKQFLTMATIKVKLRRSMVDGREGRIYYQLTHRRRVRQISTGYTLFPDEMAAVIGPDDPATAARQSHVAAIRDAVCNDMAAFEEIIARLEEHSVIYDVDDIAERLRHRPSRRGWLFVYMNEVIRGLRDAGQERTAEAYTSTRRSLQRFRDGADLRLSSIDARLVQEYERWLLSTGVVKNTVSFYMRIFRAVYVRAVDEELVEYKRPFRHVYTGVDRTVKRAVTIDVIRSIKRLDLSTMPLHGFARDMFMFSFYTRGMSFVDMAFLKKADVVDGILGYRRRKTGQLLRLRWEKPMRSIAARYNLADSAYMLPVIKPGQRSERRQYKSALSLVNRKLKDIGRMLGLSIPLTMYVARHSWASIAKEYRVPLSVISEGMGHESEMTTRIYLASLDMSVVDNANAMILGMVSRR